MSRRSNSREDILDAAERVVVGQGAAHLTLDAVAESAGISKGGLLYNFPTKEALLRAMLARLLERCDADCEAVRTEHGSAAGPAADLKAYIEVGFRAAAERQQVSAALLAAGANDPRLLSPVRDWHAGHFEKFAAGKRSPVRVLLLMLALDGLWFNELMQTSAFGPELKSQLRAEMLALAESTV